MFLLPFKAGSAQGYIAVDYFLSHNLVMLLLDLICMFMGPYGMSPMACVWRSGDDLEELVLSYCVGTRDQTQVIRFGSKGL